MKKIIAMVLCLVLTLSLVGCRNAQKADTKPVSEEVVTGTVLVIEDGAMTIEVKEKPIEEMKSTYLMEMFPVIRKDNRSRVLFR